MKKLMSSWTSKIIFLLIAVAFVIQMMVVIPSGSFGCRASQCGILFWGPHEHDSVWHLALINTSFQDAKAMLPNFAGAALTGYNALLDQIIAILVKITRIDASWWFFKVIPLTWFATLTWLLSKLAKKINPDPMYKLMLIFFVYLGGSFSYLLAWKNTGTFSGASALLSMQSALTLTNIQFALTLPLITYLLLVMIEKKQDKLTYWLTIPLIVLISMGLKFYGGIIAACMGGVYVIATHKKGEIIRTFTRLAMIAGSIAIAGLLFYGLGKSQVNASIFRITPFATINPIIEEKSLFYLPRMALARYAQNSLYNPLVIAIELITLLIFVVFNFGTRIIGLIPLTQKIFKKKIIAFDWVLLSGIGASLILTVMLSQRGEWWNTIQFIYYGFFLSSFYAAQAMSDLAKRKTAISLAVFALTLIATLPSTLDTIKVFGSIMPTSFIPEQELTVLKVLQQQPKGIVWALPAPTQERITSSGIPVLHQLHDSSYVSAYSGKVSYLNDLVQLKLTGIDYQARLDKVLRNDCEILDEINYLYSPANNEVVNILKNCGNKTMTEITKNEVAELYRVN